MSINHYSSSEHLAHQTHLWSPYYMLHSQSPENTSSSNNSDSILTNFFPSTSTTMFRQPNTSLNFNLNNEETEDLEIEEDHEIPKETLFEKPLTPSDVGKLNRLVIPKQHAERYFPLNGSNSAVVGESSEKGLLLSFEDELEKTWRFRYSYWNSSQSYVLTKGWSRFVKEKKLEAGDVVLFFRHRGDTSRMFIGWRKRNSGGEDGGGATVGGRWNRGNYSSSAVYPYPTQSNKGSGSVQYHQQQQPDNHHHCHNFAGSPNNLTMSTSNGTPKMLRLFGVNLECQADESESSTPDGSPMSSQSEAHTIYQYHQYYPNHYNHMDMNISSGGGSGENVYQRQI